MGEQTRDLIVVGASAGGVEALREFAGGLPGNLDAAVLVVLHLPPGGASALPAILARSGPLPVETAVHELSLEHGRIYVAPPDHHLLVRDGRMQLSRGPTENGYRPAVDVLFRSAAQAHGDGVIGVVLSGSLDDGSAGLASIKSRGGLALVQDPGDALYPGMPESALARVAVDQVLSANEMGAVLGGLVREPTNGGSGPPSRLEEVEDRIARAESAIGIGIPEVVDVSQPSGLACPDCHGVLFTVDELHSRYRCRVGHAWTAQALLEQQSKDVEHALWAALRALEEKRDLARRMSRNAREHGFGYVAERYTRHHDEASGAADTLRRYLLGGSLLPGGANEEPPGESA
ncbi:chemotaxis protein CheB [Amycolatopsis acidicola]|uniref:protein-glutamate methylesterase n=1 Tax=Amycolatopsis acidicola TaxID=2596893 RepID=A0A5N0URK8_9PSEU|nr:chemotaxis protein CheB [Amycolatopsis acidicola]KAA9153894.1 chemotaxis protein CheB [Amycolatopsis acidicola]